jgi:hypothetical protein
MLNPMNYVSIIEDSLYMLWQTEVQIHNFNKLGLLDQLTVVLLYRGEQPSSYAQDVSSLCRTYLFRNDQEENHFVLSNKPYGVGRLLEHRPEYSSQGFVIFDSDMLLTAPLDFKQLHGRPGLHGSTSSPPLNLSFVQTQLYDLDACLDVVGVSREMLARNNHIFGEVPYYLEGVSAEFCFKVARDSSVLHARFQAEKALGAAIEPWVAEVYCWLWNAYMEYPVYNTPELNFAWAFDPLEKLSEVKINHAAGVSSPDKGHFCKLLYHEASPLEYRDFAYVTRTDGCSYAYLQAVLETRTVRRDKKIYFERSSALEGFKGGGFKKPF